MSQQTYVNNAMQSNYQLINDLNTFNLQYAKYLKCNGENPPPTLGNCSPSDLTCCSSINIGTTTGSPGLDGLTKLQGTLLTDIDSTRTTGNILYGNLISNKSKIINI